MPTERRLPPFDLRLAMKTLAERDARLARLIRETLEFRMETDGTETPYEVLLEAIAYQSISGKAAATIFGRIKALGASGRAPTPQEILRLRSPVLRKAGLSGAKVLAMKDLARKTLAGVVPTHEEAVRMSDEELVERLTSVRGIGAWTVEMFLIFRLGRPDVLPIVNTATRHRAWSRKATAIADSRPVRSESQPQKMRLAPLATGPRAVAAVSAATLNPHV